MENIHMYLGGQFGPISNKMAGCITFQLLLPGFMASQSGQKWAFSNITKYWFLSTLTCCRDCYYLLESSGSGWIMLKKNHLLLWNAIQNVIWNAEIAY